MIADSRRMKGLLQMSNEAWDDADRAEYEMR